MIEIDLSKLERGTREGWVTVKRGGKIFRRRQRLGQKEVEVSPIATGPHPKLLAGIKKAHNLTVEFQDRCGFTALNETTGEFTYVARDYTDYGQGGAMVQADPVDFRLEDRTITRLDDGSSITIPEVEISDVVRNYERGDATWFSELDDKWGFKYSKKDFIDHRDNPDKYNKLLADLDNFIPEFEEQFEEGSGKYSKKMGLKICSNHPDQPIINPRVIEAWYGGNRSDTKMVGEAIQEVMSDNYNENNIIQQQVPLMIESAQKVNKAHGSDTIYRGETNVESAVCILEQIDEFGDADLSDKTFSCSENEKLAKWYASVHNQETARGTKTKTNVMLKIPREKFGDNVVMDYRLTGSKNRPEEEVTIIGNGMSLTGDDVMVQAVTPKRKTKKWMTFTQFKSEGGITEDIINQMRGG